jgi:hypothetical protein
MPNMLWKWNIGVGILILNMLISDEEITFRACSRSDDFM